VAQTLVAINRPKRKAEESPLRKEAKQNANIENQQAAKCIFQKG